MCGLPTATTRQLYYETWLTLCNICSTGLHCSHGRFDYLRSCLLESATQFRDQSPVQTLRGECRQLEECASVAYWHESTQPMCHARWQRSMHLYSRRTGNRDRSDHDHALTKSTTSAAQQALHLTPDCARSSLRLSPLRFSVIARPAPPTQSPGSSQVVPLHATVSHLMGRHGACPYANRPVSGQLPVAAKPCFPIAWPCFPHAIAPAPRRPRLTRGGNFSILGGLRGKKWPTN